MFAARQITRLPVRLSRRLTSGQAAGPWQVTRVAGVTGWEPDVLPGYRQRPLALGADPDGEGELVATLVCRGEPAAASRPSAPCWWCTATPTTSSTPSWPITSPAGASPFYALDLPKCGRSRRDGQTPHFTSDLAHYDAALDAALDVIARPAGTLVYGHSAGGLIVTLWLDRLRAAATPPARSAGWCSTARSSTCTGRPILRTPADLGGPDRAGPAAQDAGGPQTDPGRVRHQPAPRLLRGVRVQPGVEAGRRIPGHVRLDQRDPARPDAAAPRPGRRGAQPDPAFGPQRRRDRADPELIQRGDAVLDVTQIARWAGVSATG